ncbi:NlpC/P60 family protein [Exiguobacterium sp. s181]|uniref:XkdQ/YqbQ family protein n=1 Tax=Exiguobacterium sp. s181 TaxID=2751288 RepID=UPI001BEBE458|nr:NlpC/P60 family protein [Exiguobacterium sp. s181]
MNGKLVVAPRAPKVTLEYRPPGKTTIYDITNMSTSVNWSGSTRSVSRTLSVGVVIARNADELALTPRVGGILKMSLNGGEYFRGVIRSVNATADGMATIEASDLNWYLTKNMGSFTFKNKTASQIIKEICLKYGIKVGRIADTKYVFNRRIWLKKPISEIMQSLIYETYIQSKRRFALENNKGLLELVAVEPQKIQTMAGRGTNLIGADSSTSIDDMSTSVLLTGGNDEYRAAKKGIQTVQTNENARKMYGLMTHAEHKENTNHIGTLQTQAKQLLRELSKPETSASVTIVGDISVRAGRVLWADDPITGLTGSFWVTADTHTFDANGNYTTQCTLSRTFEMEQVLYEEPDTSDPTKDVSTVGGMPTVPGIKLTWDNGWEATAYNPSLGGINGNGDGKVSTGSKFVANRSLAVDPKQIPYGSIVYIKSSSYPAANGIYLAEDTGGAIKGKRLDLGLAATKCKAFGRHNVQIAILERGNGPADARTKAKNWSATKKKWTTAMQPKVDTSVRAGTGNGLSTKRTQVISFARSKVGKLRYKLGGGNPLLSGSNIGDCSDFTQWCFKQIGINTPNYSGDLWAKYQRVAQNKERPGDIAVFAGTIPGRGQGAPSHVGIVTDDNKMVNLQSYGCKEEAYRTGYWGKYLIGFVRVIND